MDNELLNVIDTFVNVEEDKRSLDEYIDSHSECIGTLRKFLLDGIREFIFGKENTIGRLKTIKGINSSLKGICCNFGYLVFPPNGLVQFFFRLLSKLFTQEFYFSPVIELKFPRAEHFKEIKNIKHYKDSDETLNYCALSLCVILKFLSNEHSSLIREFTNETLRIINKLNLFLKLNSMPNSLSNSQSFDVYVSFIQNLKGFSGYSTRFEAPISINLPKENEWLTYILGHVTINILENNCPIYGGSIFREKFIISWLRVLATSLLHNRFRLISMLLYILKTITMNYDLLINESQLLFIIRNNVIELLYDNSFFELYTLNLPCNIIKYEDKISASTLMGDFTLWYLDGYSKFYLSTNKSCNLERNDGSFFFQLEIIIKFWVDKNKLVSNDYLDNSSDILNNILRYLPLIPERIISILEKLFSYYVNSEFEISDDEVKLLSQILKTNKLNCILPNNEDTSSESIRSIYNISIRGINELYLKGSNSEVIVFTTHVQMVLSKYFTHDLLRSSSSFQLKHSISLTIELIRIMVENNLSTGFEFGNYLMNHLCKILNNRGEISNWGTEQCLILSELSIRIMLQYNTTTEAIIESLLDSVINETNYNTIIWTCLINLIVISCINSSEIKEEVLMKICLKLVKLELKESSSIFILIKILKPLSIMILKDVNDDYNNIATYIQYYNNLLNFFKEPCFPFGSSFHSISTFRNLFNNISLKPKGLAYSPISLNCSYCNLKNSLIPSKRLFCCTYCKKVVPTCVDIDNSICLPETKNYFSSLDILLGFKKNHNYSSDLKTILLQLITNVMNFESSNNCNVFIPLVIICLFFQSKIDGIATNLVKVLQRSFTESAYFDNFRLQTILLLSSREFLWSKLIHHSNLELASTVLSSETKFPIPLVISDVINEIIDPKTRFISNIEDLVRLSFLFGQNINDHPTKKGMENIQHSIFGNVFNITNVVDFLNESEADIEQFNWIFNRTKDLCFPLKNCGKPLKFSEQKNKFTEANLTDINITNIALFSTFSSDESFKQLFFSILNILKATKSELQNNWKSKWCRKGLNEFCRGTIPEKNESSYLSSLFTNSSKAMYYILSVLCAILMEQNTTISSTALSPGTNGILTLNIVSSPSYRCGHPNWIISLLGPSFSYLLPNFFYKSLTEKSIHLNQAYMYLKKYIPGAVSYDKLIMQVPFILLSCLNHTYLQTQTDHSNNYIFNIDSFRKLFNIKLSQISLTNELELPNAVVNTCIASLFWMITSPSTIAKYFICEKYEKVLNFHESLISECISFHSQNNEFFMKQINWLSIAIGLLIYETEDVFLLPKQKKQKITETYFKNSDLVEDYIGKNLIWLLEFYSKSILIGEDLGMQNNIQHIFFPISFIISEPPPSNMASMYWYRVFRSISLLMFISRRYIKKYATRILELLIKVTHNANMHFSCLQCWIIFINQLIEDFKENININQNIFLQLLPPMIEQLYFILQQYISSDNQILSYLESFFKLIIRHIIEINRKYFLLIPFVPNTFNYKIKRVILDCYYGDDFFNYDFDVIEKEYYQLIFQTFIERIDFSINFFSTNVPHITHEKILGSIKEILLISPIDNYKLLFGNGKITRLIANRLFFLYSKCLGIISNTSNDSLISFQKNSQENQQILVKNKYLTRMNFLRKLKKNILLPDCYLPLKLNFNTEKSASNLKNTIAMIVGTIGAIDNNIYLYLRSEFNGKLNTRNILKYNETQSEKTFQPSNTSIFTKNLDLLTVELIQNHLLAYSHWNVAAYAIQESLKYIGCHNSVKSQNKTNIWNQFSPETQDLLQPYKSTEYKLIKGTNDHLLDQLKTLSDEKTENVYEFYFWCLDQISYEVNNKEKYDKGEIPNSIKNVNILFEGCRVVSLGIPSIFNYIFPIIVECMILLCDHSVIKNLKEKLCSLIISGLESGVNKKTPRYSLLNSQKNRKVNTSSFVIHHVTYESVFIVVTHLMELFEDLLHSRIPKFLPWFNESLLEPFLNKLYLNEDNRDDFQGNERSGEINDKTISPSSTTLSLLAEATKLETAKISHDSFSKNKDIPHYENEMDEFIFKLHCNNDPNNIDPINCNRKISTSAKFFSTLSKYPAIKIIANLQFITDLPISILIQSALSCGAFTRALLLFERFLLIKHVNNDFSRKKQRKFSKSKSLMMQFGLTTKYSGNAIDYFGTSGFNNFQFDPLNPLSFYKTCFDTFSELTNIDDQEKKKIMNHILYLPYHCFLGINDTDSILGIMTIYEQMSTLIEGALDKQLIESLLREDYFNAALIYERIIFNNSGTNPFIYKSYLRCLLKAGFPYMVLDTLLNSHKSIRIDNELAFINSDLSKLNFDVKNNRMFVSEALEACYHLGSWDKLDAILSNVQNENSDQIHKSSSFNNFYMDIFIPSNLDSIAQKFDIYRGKLLLHLHYIKADVHTEKMHESFNNTLEKARDLLLTPLSITWNDCNSRSISIIEKLHLLTDIEFIYYLLANKKKISNKEYTTKFNSDQFDIPEWFRICELFVHRVDNTQTTIEKKRFILSQAKITLEIAGFDLASFSLLLVLEKSKVAMINTPQNYASFLDSFEMVEVGCQRVGQSPYLNHKNISAFGVSDFNLSNLCSYNIKENVPGFIQLDNSISIFYFEKIFNNHVNLNKVTWTNIEKRLIHEWEQGTERNYIISLNQHLLVTYLSKLFQRNQIRVAVHFYELIMKNRTCSFLDNNTLSEVNLIYLDWAIKSSMISPEKIINTFNETLELRSNCEKTYFQFASYLDNYFHLIISNVEGENNLSNINSMNNYNLGSVLQYEETIISCINMYLNCLKYGNSFVYPSLSRVLFLMFNHSNIILKIGIQTKKYENLKVIPDVMEKLKNEIINLSPTLWYLLLPQLLSRCQHPGLGSILVQPLVAKIIRALPYQSAWYFVSMLKSNSSDRKNTAIGILKMSKALNLSDIDPSITENDYSLIIDDYIRLFDNLTVLALDTSTGNALQIQPRDQKVAGRISNKYMSLRSDFQTLYHSIKNLNKSKGLIIPTQIQLGTNQSPVPQVTNTLFSQFLPIKNRRTNLEKGFLSTYIISKNSPFSDFITITGMEDTIYVLPSKQKPKKIGLIGSDGKTYYYLVKNEKRGDLRKDMRLMELAQLLNQRLSMNRKDLSLRTFSVIPLSEVAGIIEWVPDVTTLGSIVINEWKELIGNTKFHRQLLDTQDILRQHSMQFEKLYKLYSEEILPKYPPVLHNWFFKNFSTKSSYFWLKSKQKYTKSTAVWSMFGYIVGLGDRHAENILIDMQSGEIIHVDFDCLFGKGFLLEIPEIVPFRLTPNVVIAMGSCGVEGTFTGTSISAMGILRSPFNKSLIMTFLEAFIHDPLIEWMRPGKTSQLSSFGGNLDPVSFAAVAKGHSHLRTIYRKLNGMVDCFPQSKNAIWQNGTSNSSQRRQFHESGLGLSVESQVLELINSAKCKRNLSQMYAGWMPQL
ncbi:serine/threonine-protein kinase ATR [Cryptosporidium felis]|nr:serine/threonine-protein kinase ATR [Cryptosporidium felis]